MIGAVVLAAGAATRFGAPKQRLMLDDVLRSLRAAPIDEIVVVEGAHALGEIAGARVAACPAWMLGPGASLRCGLQALGGGVEAAVVVLADGPDLDPEAVRRVVERWRAHGGEVLAAAYGGERGHPLLLARSAWGDIPDEGLRGRAPLLVACDDLRHPGDVDTPGHLPDRLR